MKKIKVNLEQNSYDIIIGSNLITKFNEFSGGFIKDGKAFVITDVQVAKHHLEPLKASLEKSGIKVFPIILPNGESTKNFEKLEFLLSEILSHQPERKTMLIALGGGVIGDITGFAASILLRGVQFIQVPTTLLAMVDSSVGGKTGINTKFGKNLIGSFYQPKLVLADIETLKTLPEREVLAGYAEVAKYGLLGDEKFFNELDSKITSAAKIFDDEILTYIIEKSCIAKSEIVSQDEKEGGVRALLNLGHTFGHALEAGLGYDGRILHGEGVAMGMVLAFKFSEFLGLCEKGEAVKVENHFKKLGMKTSVKELPKKFTIDEMVGYMYQDKKVADGKLVFILAKRIGETFIKKDVLETDLREFLKSEV
jgi:3-dehydroquinate synthase